MYVGTATKEISMEVSQKPALPYDLAIPLLGIYPKKSTYHRDICTPMFIFVLFTMAKLWNQPEVG
jgi:hypothetical protein